MHDICNIWNWEDLKSMLKFIDNVYCILNLMDIDLMLYFEDDKIYFERKGYHFYWRCYS